jgi:hypothetical protein
MLAFIVFGIVKLSWKTGTKMLNNSQVNSYSRVFTNGFGFY